MPVRLCLMVKAISHRLYLHAFHCSRETPGLQPDIKLSTTVTVPFKGRLPPREKKISEIGQLVLAIMHIKCTYTLVMKLRKQGFLV